MEPGLNGFISQVRVPILEDDFSVLVPVLVQLYRGVDNLLQELDPMESCVATLKLSWWKPSVVVAMHQTTM